MYVYERPSLLFETEAGADEIPTPTLRRVSDVGVPTKASGLIYCFKPKPVLMRYQFIAIKTTIIARRIPTESVIETSAIPRKP